MKQRISGPEQLQKRLDQGRILQVCGCHDILSAYYAHQAGFECLFLSGYGFAASMYGNPDIGLTSLSELTSQARHLTKTQSLPVIVDVDNGYGGHQQLIRLIRELEQDNVAGIQLEDQVFDKKCGHESGKTVLSLQSYLEKLKTVIKHRKNNTVVIARTDAENMDEAIMRATAFHEHGADLTIIDGLKHLEDIERFASEVPGKKQLNLIYGKRPSITVEKASALGFSILLYSTASLYLSSKAMQHGLATLFRTGDLEAIHRNSLDFGAFQAFILQRYNERNEH